MSLLLNNAKAITTTTGTGTITLGEAVSPFLTWATAGAVNGQVYAYRIDDANGAWEIGQGTYTSSGTTLSRTLTQSSTGSLLNLSGYAVVTSIPRVNDISAQKAFVYLNTATNTTNAGWQKIPIDTVSYDTGSFWNAANKRFIPIVPGYYQISARVRTNSSAQLGSCALGLNGTQVLGVGPDATVGSGSTFALGGTGLIQCNGSTDYIELFAYTTNVTALTTGSFDTYMQLIGPLPGVQ